MAATMPPTLHEIAEALLVVEADRIAEARATASAHAHARRVAGALADRAYDDHLAVTPALAAIGDWIKNAPSPLLILSGPHGSGKSVAAARWAGKVAAAWGTDFGAGALVVDGLEALHAPAIARRTDAGLVTLATTTLDREDLAAKIPALEWRLAKSFVRVDAGDTPDAGPQITGVVRSQAIAVAALDCQSASAGMLSGVEAVQAVAALRDLLPLAPHHAEAAKRHVQTVAEELARRRLSCADALGEWLSECFDRQTLATRGWGVRESFDGFVVTWCAPNKRTEPGCVRDMTPGHEGEGDAWLAAWGLDGAGAGPWSTARGMHPDAQGFDER